MIFTLRVTTGQERIVSEMLVKKAKAEKLDVYSVVYLENIKGYLFIESLDENTSVKLIQRVKHVKGLLKKPIVVDEITSLIKATKQPTITIENGDIIEMVSGPFKGEKAKVTKFDIAKEEVTVELMEVAVPIPVTVKAKMIKLFQKAGADN